MEIKFPVKFLLIMTQRSLSSPQSIQAQIKGSWLGKWGLCLHWIGLIVRYLMSNEEIRRFSFWIDWLFWLLVGTASGYLKWVMNSSICFGSGYIFSLFHITCQHGRQWNAMGKIWGQITQQNTGTPLEVNFESIKCLLIFSSIDSKEC